MWSDEWIGRPYRKLGRGPEFDCLGLFLALQRERFGRELPDPLCTMLQAARDRVAEQFRPMFNRVESPQEGDALLFRVREQLLHVGFAVGPQHMLHIENEAGSVLERWNTTRWFGRLEGIYRVR